MRHFPFLYTFCLLNLLSGCGSSPAEEEAGSSSGMELADAGTDADTTDAATDAAVPACGDATSLPGMSCGTLTWSVSDTKARKRNHHITLAAETSKGAFLYALGGFEGMGQALSNVDRMPVSSDGSVGAPVDDTALPVGTGGLMGGVVSNVMVIAGGLAGSSVSSKSYSAVIHEDGSLAAWKPAGSIVHARFHGGAFVNGKTMYVLGGFDSAHIWDDAVRATVEPDGTVSSWTSAGALMGPRSHFSVSLVDGYVFLAGGLDKRETSSPVPSLPDVSRGRLADDGSIVEWTPMPPLLVPVATHASFFYGGYLYVAGGISGGTNLKEEKRVWRAPIDKDHLLGAWEAVASLPVARGHVHQIPLINNRVYSVAGALDLSLNSTDHIDIGTFE